MKTVYFATNRKAALGGTFGPGLADELTFGVAIVEGGSVRVERLSVATFLQDVVKEMIAAENEHFLATIHGFNYTFEESILRAAANDDWFAGGKPAIRSTVVALCWPSNGHMDVFDYMSDYRDALASARDVNHFFGATAAILKDWRHAKPEGRATLLAHSMGNHVLRHGVEGLPMDGLVGTFDLLASVAGDADARSISPGAGGMFNALRLAKKAAVYFNREDHALAISSGLHGCLRVGQIGSPTRLDAAYGPLGTAFVDAQPVNSFFEDPEGHQYYRAVPTCRDDLCAEMLGVAVADRFWHPERGAFELRAKVPA